MSYCKLYPDASLIYPLFSHLRSMRLLYMICFWVAVSGVSAQSFESYRTLCDTTLYSEELGYARGAEILVPFNWQKEYPAAYPLLFIFDKQNDRSYRHMLHSIDYLTTNNQMPACIVVGMDAGEGRNRYLETQLIRADSNGRMESNERYILDDLIPHLQQFYQAGDFILLAGHSRYGYFVTHMLAAYPETINAAIAISPFFRQKEVQLVDSLMISKAGTFPWAQYFCSSMGNDFQSDRETLDSAMLQKKIVKPNLVVRSSNFPQAGHTATPGLTFGQDLYAIFEYWSESQHTYLNDANANPILIEPLMNDNAVHYGVDIPFSLGILNGKGSYFFFEEDYEKAMEVWTYMMQFYPNFSEGWLYIAECKIALTQNWDAERELFLNSISISVIYSDAEKSALRDYLQELQP